MTTPGRPVSDDGQLAEALEDMLGLLAPYRPKALRIEDGDGRPLGSLLEQCRRRVDTLRAREAATLRVVHHFACTGGTLISRALAAQPSTMVLSEVDPLSTLFRPPGGFAPQDLIHLARQDRSPPREEVIAEMFLSQLEVLIAALRREGRRLVLRDHSHSHFCVGPCVPERPSLGALLAGRIPTRSVLTVRHPLDSFLSLANNGWMHLEPATLGEYARRYHAFLDAYPGVPIVHYEPFVKDPGPRCAALCALLDLPLGARWMDLLPIIRLSGDSGRRGDTFGLRARRPVPAGVETEAPDYRDLCARLGYDPDPAASAIPRSGVHDAAGA